MTTTTVAIEAQTDMEVAVRAREVTSGTLMAKTRTRTSGLLQVPSRGEEMVVTARLSWR